MKIYKGRVAGPSDFKVYERPADGKFYVEIGADLFEVTYTSPFYTVGYGGILAIPDPGSTVLVARDDDGSYYYLSTVIEKGDPESKKQPKNIFPKIKNVYPDKSTLSRRVTFENQHGAGLKMNHLYKKSNIIDNVVLASSRGKMLVLNDSFKNDSIALLNEHFDGLTINSGGNSANETRSIQMTSKNSVTCLSHQGTAQMIVGNGGHINIINNSSDVFNTNVIDPSRDGGDVNIVSQNRDVNIAVRGLTSNIFITTKLVRIRIDDRGTVSIQAPNINFKATQSINLDAPTINMNSEIETNLYTQGKTNITSSADTEIEGNTIQLNSGRIGTPKPVIPDPTLTDLLD